MADQVEAASLASALAKIGEPWAPHTVARVNDYEVRVAKIHGDFNWHHHTETDEFFMCLTGEFVLQVQLETGLEEIHLRAGEIYVVPKGVQHRPVAKTPAEILLFERAGTVNTGD